MTYSVRSWPLTEIWCRCNRQLTGILPNRRIRTLQTKIKSTNAQTHLRYVTRWVIPTINRCVQSRDGSDPFWKNWKPIHRSKSSKSVRVAIFRPGVFLRNDELRDYLTGSPANAHTMLQLNISSKNFLSDSCGQRARSNGNAKKILLQYKRYLFPRERFQFDSS